MSLDDIAYYRRRAFEERELARDSTNPEAAAAHAELASHYEALIARADLLPPHRNPPTDGSESPNPA